MNSPNPATPALNAILGQPLDVGDPDVSGPLAVFPLFGPPAELDYAPFAAVHEQVTITELEGGASVNDLTVHNRYSKPVLLFEGEELLGAQQNRVLDISLLIAAGTKTVIPVSCVEQGRWDGRRHGERFQPSRQAADPDLRRKKKETARKRVAAGLDARADQGAVWAAVSVREAELGASSPTGAMHDIYESRRDQLSELRGPIGLHDGQCGAVVAIAGRIAILDFVGRDDVWSQLHPALVEGYALDALRAGQATVAPDPPELQTVRGFTLLTTDAPAENRTAGPGLGETIRFAASGVAGSALIAEEELVQITAYLDSEDGRTPEQTPPTGRRASIPRPSRRGGRR